MITLRYTLKRLVNWLEAHFPEKLEITKAMFNDLHSELGALNASYQMVCADKQTLDKRVTALEVQLKEINMSLGIQVMGQRVRGNQLER